MKNHTFFILLLVFLGLACENQSVSESQEEPTQEEQASSADLVATEDERSTPETTPVLVLDEVDLNQLIKLDTYGNADAGDCSTQAAKYQLGEQFLVYEHNDCGDYGRPDIYYLLSAEEELEQVLEKRRSNYVDTKEDGSPDYKTEITKKSYDFRQSPARLMALSDVLANNIKNPVISRIKLDETQAWVIVRAEGDDTVLGQKSKINDLQVYEAARQLMIDSLVSLNGIPSEIPIRFEGEVYMGVRGEYRSMCSEAIDMANKLLIEKAKDPFNRTKKQMEEVEVEGDDASPTRWKGYYAEMFQ